MKQLSKLWLYLIGDKERFSLEARIFNIICIFGYGTLLAELIFNVLTRELSLVLISVFVLVIHTFHYYLSRFRNRFILATIIYSILNNFIFSFHYYYSEGLKGGTLLIYILSFYLILLVSPRKHYKFWIPLNIFFVAASVIIQLEYPHLIPAAFADERERYFHILFTYLVVAAFTYLGTSFLKRNYELEKRMAEERARAIDEQNKMIIGQNKELERLNSEKAKLFSIVAHDLKAPLNSIQNYLQFLKDYELSPRDKEDVENQLLETTRFTSEMLASILIWSRSQMEGVSMNIERVNLLGAVLNTIKVENSLAALKDIYFSYKIDKDIEVLADVNLLQLIVRNLIQNAIKFTPEGGFVALTATVKNGKCDIMVKDSGIGIPDDLKEFVFTTSLPSRKGTKSEGGIGLGLVLCKEFAEKQNGSLRFQSLEGRGSVFTLTLNTVPL